MDILLLYKIIVKCAWNNVANVEILQNVNNVYLGIIIQIITVTNVIQNVQLVVKVLLIVFLAIITMF